jgi:hypothetical protein
MIQTNESIREMIAALDRDTVIRTIRASLRRRSGKAWSVTGGRGTAYGWITIDVPPSRRRWQWDGITPTHSEGHACGHASLVERDELARLLGLTAPVHFQGHSIPAGHDYYREYLDRAEGRTPSVLGTPYWD